MLRVIAGFLVLFTWSNVYAQGEKQEGDQPDVDLPGHAILKAWAGTWDTLDRFRPAPDAPYSESNGMHTVKLEFNGTWLVSDLQATLGGVPYRAHMQIGYEPLKKKYVGTVINNLTPQLQLLDGSYDQGSKILTMRYEGLNSKGAMEPQRATWEIKSETTAVMKIYFKSDKGVEFVGLEKNYTKR